MSLFPLYDKVIQRIDGTETCLNKTHSAIITKLSQENLNIIYLLILHHWLNSPNCKNRSDIPYGGKTISNGKGIIFRRLNQIPSDVQKIIYRYLTMISD